MAVLVQRQELNPNLLDVDAPLLDVPDLLLADAPAAPGELHFSVRYALAEYLSFMWQHGGYLIRRRRIGRIAGLLMQARSTATAGLHFLLQGRARRTYQFTVDAHGVLRASASGVTVIGWDQVRTIRKYSRGFMLVMARGTLPIPYRCLAGGQSAALDGYACALRARTVNKPDS
ncbi:MAG: YcxB family protein [Pseudomonadota bacterium]